MLYLIPGHLGKYPPDSGAVSPAGWVEASFVGQVAGALSMGLSARRMTHCLDASGAYRERGARADAQHAQLVVHLHADAVAGDIGPDLSSVFYWPGSQVGRTSAEAIGESLGGVVPWPVRVMPAEDAPWLRNVRALLSACRAPAVVVELGFTDGALGRTWLPAHVRELGAALAEGVSRAAG